MRLIHNPTPKMAISKVQSMIYSPLNIILNRVECNCCRFMLADFIKFSPSLRAELLAHSFGARKYKKKYEIKNS